VRRGNEVGTEPALGSVRFAPDTQAVRRATLEAIGARHQLRPLAWRLAGRQATACRISAISSLVL
jgi:hypothetical protein